MTNIAMGERESKREMGAGGWWEQWKSSNLQGDGDEKKSTTEVRSQ